MKCSKCGTEFEGNFCPECGTKVFETCSKCGAQVKPGQKFCQQCGEPLYVSNLSEQKNSNSDNTVNSVQTPVKTEEKIAQSAQTSATRTTEQNNVYAQSAMASAESQHSWATNSVAVNAQKFKSSKICNILALISNYIGLCAAALFALLNFAFLAADFYFIEFFGEKESISCYDALDLSGDPANSIITIIILSVVMLGVAVLHGLTLFKEHKAKAYYYIFNKIKTDYIFPIIECLLMFAIAISGCISTSWINSNSEDLLSVGSGINCVIAFAFIWFILIAACTAFNFFFVKYAPYGDSVMPKKEHAPKDNPEYSAQSDAYNSQAQSSSKQLTTNLKDAYLSQVKASVSLRRSFPQLVFLFILVLGVAAGLAYTFINIYANNKGIQNIIMFAYPAVFLIVALCMAIPALKKINLSTNGKQLKFKYRFAAICCVFFCLSAWMLVIDVIINLITKLGDYAFTNLCLIDVAINLNFYLFVIIALISFAAFIFAIVVTRRQLAIYRAAIPDSHCDMDAPAENLPMLFDLYPYVKSKEFYDDAAFNSRCEKARKSRISTSVTGYIMVALLVVAMLICTLMPYFNVTQISRADDISVGDSRSKVEKTLGSPDFENEYTAVWFGGKNADDFATFYNLANAEDLEGDYDDLAKIEALYIKLENATTRMLNVNYNSEDKVSSVYFDGEFTFESEQSYVFDGNYYDFATIANLSLPSLKKVESELNEFYGSFWNALTEEEKADEYEAYYSAYINEGDYSVKYYDLGNNRYFNCTITNFTITVQFNSSSYYGDYISIKLSTPKTEENSYGTSVEIDYYL